MTALPSFDDPRVLPSFDPPTQPARRVRRWTRARVVVAAVLAVLILAVGTLATLLVTTRGTLDRTKRTLASTQSDLRGTQLTLATRTDQLTQSQAREEDLRTRLAKTQKDLAATTDQLTQTRGDLTAARTDASGAHAEANHLAAVAKTERMCLEHVIRSTQLAEAGDYTGAMDLLTPDVIAQCQAANRDVAALSGGSDDSSI